MNKEIFKETILYILDNYNVTSKEELVSILYLVDFNYYEMYEFLLTETSYINNDIPSPKGFKEVYIELLNDGFIDDDFSILKSFSLRNLEYKEIYLINEVLNIFKHLNLNEILEYVKGDLPVKVSKPLEVLDPEFVFYRDPEYSIRVY